MSCFIFKSKSALCKSYSGDSMHYGQRNQDRRERHKGDIHVTIQIDNEALASKAMCTAFSWWRGTYKRSMHLNKIQTKKMPKEKPKKCSFGKSSEQTSHRPSDATIKTLAEFCEFRPAQRPQEPPRLVLLIQDDLFHIRHAG